MKKWVIRCICIFLLFTAGCTRTVQWNGEKAELAELYMVVDVTDGYAYTGMVDYVFVGTVTEVISDVLPTKAKKHEDSYSTYRIHVDENLKGNLTEEVVCSKMGGLKRDGVMYLVSAETPNGKMIMDLGLPELNRQYVFMAYSQPDGSLVLSEILDDRGYTEDVKKEYEDYIEHEIRFDRERFPSDYDKKE